MRLLDVDPTADLIIGSYKYEEERAAMDKARVRAPRSSAVRRREKDQEYESDSSEELQYGPGIVNRLKTKYLSLTLRESDKRGVRPSLANLRRSTSLENVLDDEAAPPLRPPKAPPAFKKAFNTVSRSSKVSQYCAKYMSINTAVRGGVGAGRESIKRAQSVDALFRNEPKCTVVVAAVESNGGAADRPLPRLPEIAKELPPPHLVKQTLKLFENKTDCKTECGKDAPEKKSAAAPVKPAVSPKPLITGDKVTLKPRSPVKRHAVSTPAAAKPPPYNGKPKADYCVRLTSPPPQPSPQKKFVTGKALENIEKEGSMVRFSFRDSLASPKSYLPRANNNALVNGQAAERPKQDAPPPPSPVKQVAVIRPVVSNKAPPPSPLTDLEIEKNRINKVKSIETSAPPPIVVKQTETVKAVVTVERVTTEDRVTGVSLWGDVTARHHAQNTMVFNFVNRKEIPDYIENDGLVFTPHNSHRVKCNGEEESDEDATDSLPCPINIIGGNILINGKSNLRKQPKQHKVNLRIQFNDAATTLFEYPREDLACSDEPPTPPLTSPSSPHPKSSLSTYTPSKLGVTEGSWELGVTRVSPVTSPVAPVASGKVATTIPSLQADDYLKPVDSQDVTPWSQETTADILF